ncbi:MAG: response regulator [Acidobacteria bacterium]|nr:response regulator [Acidobacteriota bacterium]
MNSPLRETILVVTELQPIREYLGQVLTGAGYSVLSASGSDEALAKSKTHDGPIDLLVSALWLHTMTGIELRQALSATRPGLRALYCAIDDARATGRFRLAAPQPATLLELVRTALNEAA